MKFLKIIMFIAVGSGLAMKMQSQNIKTLAPSEIGEFVTPDEDGSEDGTYLYRADPNGQYYHFESFATLGESQWNAFLMYDEVFTASSTLPSSQNNSYEAKNLSNGQWSGVGGRRNLAWCEGVKGYGIGEWVKMSVKTQTHLKSWDMEICITSLMIVNGYAKDAVTWKNNSRVKTLRLYVGDKPWCDLQLQDTIKPQIFDIEEIERIFLATWGKKIAEKANLVDDDEQGVVYQTDLRFEIIEVYKGDKIDDTCITGIALNFYGGIY